MEMRPHEIDFANEIAKRVADHLQRVGSGWHEVDSHPPPQVQAGALEQVGPGARIDSPTLVPTGSNGASEHPPALEQSETEAALVEALEQAQALLLEQQTALDEARGEREDLAVHAYAAHSATAAAMKMFNALTPQSDGQRALYPLRGEHLQNFRIMQQRVDELHEVAQAQTARAARAAHS